MLTKLRSFPASLYRCAFRPECFRVRSASSSPTVAPAASTASCLSVYGRSGVGMRIFGINQLSLVETRSIFFQVPHGQVRRRGFAALAGQVPRLRADDGYDDVGECRPRVIKI